MVVHDFWEVGASGRRYGRAYVLDELEKRHSAPHDDVWQAKDFHCRQLGQDVYLLTYTLIQDSVRVNTTLHHLGTYQGGLEDRLPSGHNRGSLSDRPPSAATEGRLGPHSRDAAQIFAAPFARASSSAFSTRGGDIGRASNRTPVASATALAMVAMGGTIGVSPTPRTP